MQNNIINNNNKKIPNINNFTPNSDQIFPISFYNTTLNINIFVISMLLLCKYVHYQFQIKILFPLL